MPTRPTSSLATYRKKRNFQATPEPSGGRSRSAKRESRRFVVQLHRATRLHYDFRLEAAGTLKSWAVPKGPSLNPADKRLAMQVEDHPLDYAGFEGRIPKGNYGAGEVVVWDRGTYEPLENGSPAQQIASGSFKFLLHGKKLRGAFALARMRDAEGKGNAWLLIKHGDQFAVRDGGTPRDDRSVVSGRTLDDMASNRRVRLWFSNRPPKSGRLPESSRTHRSDNDGAEAESPQLKRPDKVLFPADGFTKADLAGYYDAVAGNMLPYLKDRPLSLERFPNGIDGLSFFEKNAPRGAPSWLKTVAIGDDKHRTINYVICNDRRTLAYLANLAAIVIHVWTSKVESLDVPDFVFFDLDPGDRCPLARLARVAVALRDELTAIGLMPVVKTSGGSGFHVLVPLRPAYDYSIVRTFGELIARRIAGLLPDDVTLERSIPKRPPSAVYFDYVQIGQGKTMVAPFSVRARAGAPVSMPIAWGDVESLGKSRAANADKFFAQWTIATAPAILRRRRDPWAGAFSRPRGLEAAIKAARAKW